jgi:hypothetical protein
LALTAAPAWSQNDNGTVHHHTGTVIKYNSPISHLVSPDDMMKWGENIPSDFDWNTSMISPTIEPNWIVADDFWDPDTRPVLTVKWWGSYFPDSVLWVTDATGGMTTRDFEPGDEDAYVISFFDDIPGVRGDPLVYSRPDGLLGTYTIPKASVRMKETTYKGWDGHDIWEYEADLWAACLDHEDGIYARPDGFHQQPNHVYWISIAAEVGHGLELITDPLTNETRWLDFDTGKQAHEHYWGWHTTAYPDHLGDYATMSHLSMLPAVPPLPAQWHFLPWEPIHPDHSLYDMAYQLKTIPEPASAVLVCVALIAICWYRRRIA